MTTINANARFHCQWPEGYGDAEPQDVDPTFFNDDNGYTEDIIAEIANLEVGQTHIDVGAAHERHTITRVPDVGQPLLVLLDSVGNIDHGENPFRPRAGVPTKIVTVHSLAEASEACQKYIDEHDLGGGNWTGGLVTDQRGTAIAEISYNGRINPQGYTDGNAHLFRQQRNRMSPR